LASFFYIKNKKIIIYIYIKKKKIGNPLFPGYIDVEDNVACRVE
jgi:hypothetical protein